MALLSSASGWFSAYTAAPVLLLALMVSWLIILYSMLAGHLSDIPNLHWSARWSRSYNLYIKYFYSVRLVHYEAHVRNDGGALRPIVRVGPNEVSIMSSEGVKAVWGAGFERSPWYKVFYNFGCV